MNSIDTQELCPICPARVLEEGEFNVVDDVALEYGFDEALGCRVDERGVPTCIHPRKVGMAPVRITVRRLDIDTSNPPSEPEDLGPWLSDRLAIVSEADLAEAVEMLTGSTAPLFEGVIVTEALRYALTQRAEANSE